MADRIKGITVEIGGDTTGLSKALSGVNKEIKSTQSQLKDVNQLLKLDPTNAQLLAQKQKLLTKAVGETKSKMEQLKSVESQMEEGLKSGSLKQEQYDAWQREIVATAQELKKLEDQVKNTDTFISATLKEAGGKISAVGDKISGVGESMSKNVTAPIVAVGAASLAAFSEVDEAMDILVTKTGASGEALDSMSSIVKDIATTIPTSFEAAGTAVGEVNTRFGLTGKALEDLSTQFIEFATINNTDVTTSIGNTQKILSQFSLDSSQAGNVLGVLTSVSQKTGLSVDELSSLLQQNGATFKEMGLGVGESITLMGNFEKAGIDSSSMLTGLKKAAANYSKDGKSMEQGLSDLIKRLQDSSTQAEATTEAYSVFGTKGGLAFITAAKEGRISLDGLSTDLSSFGSTVSDTYNGTLDGIDSATTAMNALKEAGAEVGEALGTTLAPILQSIAGYLKSFAAWFSDLSPGMQDMIVKIALIVAAVGPMLVLIGKVISTVGTIVSIASKIAGVINIVRTAFMALNVTMLANPIILIIAAIAALVAAFLYLWNNCDGFRQFWIDLWENVKQVAITVWNAISSFFSTLWQGIKTVAETIWNGIASFFSTLWEGIKTVFTTVLTVIQTIVTTYFNLYQTIIMTVFSVIQTVITTVWSAIATVIVTVVTTIQTFLTTTWNAIKTVISTVVDGIKSTVSSAFTTMWNGIKTVISGIYGTIKGGFDNAIGFVQGLASSAFNWGADIINGIVNGIKSCIGKVKDAVVNVAETIKSFLHFSVPDEGPLTDYESWMPDFMKGLADGIKTSKDMVAKAVSGVAEDMVISPTAKLNSSSDLKSTSASNAAAISQYVTGPLVEVKEMTVRSDNDIRSISQELNTLMQSGRRAKGII